MTIVGYKLKILKKKKPFEFSNNFKQQKTFLVTIGNNWFETYC